MSDREEVRWKLSNLQKLVSSAINRYEKHFDIVYAEGENLYKKAIQERNTLVGGIGFGILLVISLVSMELLSEDYVVSIPIGIGVALTIFALINILATERMKKYNEFIQEFQIQKSELTELEGWLTGIAIRDDIKSENIFTLTYLVSSIFDVMDYDLELTKHRILGLEKPNIEKHAQSCNKIKYNLENSEIPDLKIILRLKKFLKQLDAHNIKNIT